MPFPGCLLIRRKVPLIPVLGGVLVLFFLYYFLFVNIFSFNFELTNNGQYLISLITLSGWTLFSGLLLFFKRNLNSYQIGHLLIAILFFCFLSFSSYYSFANEYFVYVSSIVLLFIVLLYSNLNAIHLIIVLFALSFVVQLGIAFVQMGGFSFNIRNLNIKGSLQNSGVLCNYLVIQLPFFYYLLFIVKTKGFGSINKRKAIIFSAFKMLFFIGVLCFTTFIVWKTTTRTAIVMLAIMLVTGCLQYFGEKIKVVMSRMPKLIIVLSISLFTILLILMSNTLFKLKMLSAFGRIMKLDIAADHFSDNFWFGTGIGRFTWYYPQWQAQYFATHPFPPKEYFLSAGESYIIFNEFVQLVETIGIIGMAGVAIGALLFFKTKSSKNEALLNTVKLTVVAILICSLFSYPLHVNMLLLQLAFCFAVSMVINERQWHLFEKLKTKVPVLAGKTILTVSVVAGGLITYSAYENWRAMEEWQHLQKLELSTTEIQHTYESLGTWLNENGKFLTDYGMFLQLYQVECEKTISTLENAKKYFISKKTIELLGDAYKRCGNSRKAIENYEWLADFIPGRFTIKFELLKLYEAAGDRIKTKQMALYILSMPVKISSDEVNSIKKETMLILRKL